MKDYLKMIKEGWFGSNREERIGLALGYLGAVVLLILVVIYFEPNAFHGVFQGIFNNQNYVAYVERGVRP